jgi:3-isopropylmalate/(R)-2-methylmalate dehydratase small subunit
VALPRRRRARQDNSRRPLNPDFVLNQPRYRARRSCWPARTSAAAASREHAPWALDSTSAFARCIAPSFADIFFNNSFKNGLLPIVLPAAEIDALFALVGATPGYRLLIDLERQQVIRPDGRALPFAVDAFRKECLLNGWDDIGLTLRHAELIKAFEDRRRIEQPWLFA